MGRGNGRGGGVGSFTDEQVAMYKECFKLMDIDKDGVINKNDLRAAFDNVGKTTDLNAINDTLLKKNAFHDFSLSFIQRPLDVRG